MTGFSLQPGEQFPFNWNVSMPGDTNTYYPQVVIRNSRSKALLATLNMTSDDGVMYRVLWQVPQDGSGMGFYIDAVISVYTDSGHTTLSQDYEIESNTYLVQERPNRNLGLGYGGGYDYLNLKDLKKALQEHLNPLREELKPKTPKELSRLAVLESGLGQLGKSMSLNEGERTKVMAELRKELKDNFGKVYSNHELTGKELAKIKADFATYEEKFANIIDNFESLQAQNSEQISEVVNLAKDYAEQTKQYVDSSLKDFTNKMMDEMRDIFDQVQVIQVYGNGNGLRKMANRPNPEEEKERRLNDAMRVANRLMGI